MAKLYLHELDSVRNSRKEMIEGQKTLYETVMNGDTVILTFNQLVDSPVFLCALDHEECYESILSLLRHGRIRVSAFRRKPDDPESIMETPAHYLLSSLNTNITSLPLDLEVFVHSALPIKAVQDNQPVFEALRNAVLYSDPQLLVRYLENHDIPSEERRAKPEEIAFLDRYVRLIIEISITNKAHNEPLPYKQSSPKLTELIGLVVNNLPKTVDAHTIKGCQPEAVKQACSFLRNLSCELCSQKRSEWEKRIERKYKSSMNEYSAEGDGTHGDTAEGNKGNLYAIAEAIVDLCYIYTCELSINDLDIADYQIGSKRLPIWENTGDNPKGHGFGKVFIEELGNYIDGYHGFLHVDVSEIYDPIELHELPDWKVANRVVSRVENDKSSMHTTTFLLLTVLSILTMLSAISEPFDAIKGSIAIVIAAATIFIAAIICNIPVQPETIVIRTEEMAFRGSVAILILLIIISCMKALIGTVFDSLIFVIIAHCVLALIIPTISYILSKYCFNNWYILVSKVSFRVCVASLCYICLLFFIDEIGKKIEFFLNNSLHFPVTAIGAFLLFALLNTIDFEDLLHIPDFDDCLSDAGSAIADYFEICRGRKGD